MPTMSRTFFIRCMSASATVDMVIGVAVLAHGDVPGFLVCVAVAALTASSLLLLDFLKLKD